MSELIPGMKKWLLASTAGVLLLSGCASASPQDAGAAMCKDKLQYAIEQEMDADASWIEAELDVTNVEVERRGDANMPDTSGSAFDVAGEATVSLPSGRKIDVDWTCFTQTSEDGKTYADIMSVR